MMKTLFSLAGSTAYPTLALWVCLIAFVGVVALAFGLPRKVVARTRELPLDAE